MTQNSRKPPIAIKQAAHARLLRLAETLVRQNSELADQLFAELERAEIVQDTTQDREIVDMGSTLQYQTDSGDSRTVTLVYPHEEDIAAGRVSILTPIGVALIGLSAGDSIDWQRRDGRIQRLTVTHVARPSPTKGEAPTHAGATP
jgi:regulator of nucleoside diphosphate kinase